MTPEDNVRHKLEMDALNYFRDEFAKLAEKQELGARMFLKSMVKSVQKNMAEALVEAGQEIYDIDMKDIRSHAEEIFKEQPDSMPVDEIEKNVGHFRHRSGAIWGMNIARMAEAIMRSDPEIIMSEGELQFHLSMNTDLNATQSDN